MGQIMKDGRPTESEPQRHYSPLPQVSKIVRALITESTRDTGTKRHDICGHWTHFLSSLCIQNAFAVGTPLRTPLGELTAYIAPLS